MTMVAGSGMSTFVQASYSHIPKCKPKKRMKPIGLEQFVQVKIMSVYIYMFFGGSTDFGFILSSAMEKHESEGGERGDTDVSVQMFRLACSKQGLLRWTRVQTSPCLYGVFVFQASRGACST